MDRTLHLLKESAKPVPKTMMRRRIKLLETSSATQSAFIANLFAYSLVHQINKKKKSRKGLLYAKILNL